jgi:hypothetical protein
LLGLLKAKEEKKEKKEEKFGNSVRNCWVG